ncbi:MAG: DUF2892 domain-containing protein [Longimicrobiales bacterium]
MRTLGTILPILLGLTLMLAGNARAQQLADRFDPPAAAAFVGSAPAPGAALAPMALNDGNGFETTAFAQFIASPAGRILRGVVGAGMIAGGVAMGDTGGTVLAVAGAVPLSAGIFDLCYVSALLGGPIRGEEIRAAGRGR